MITYNWFWCSNYYCYHATLKFITTFYIYIYIYHILNVDIYWTLEMGIPRIKLTKKIQKLIFHFFKKFCTRYPPFFTTLKNKNLKGLLLICQNIFWNFLLGSLQLLLLYINPKSYFLYPKIFFEFCLRYLPIPTTRNHKKLFLIC